MAWQKKNYGDIAAAAAKSLQSCPTLCNPIDGSPPGSPAWDSPGNNTGVGCHFLLQCMKVKSESEVTQSCPTPSEPMDFSLPGSSDHGIFQAGVLEWGAIAFSDGDLRICLYFWMSQQPPSPTVALLFQVNEGLWTQNSIHCYFSRLYLVDST